MANTSRVSGLSPVKTITGAPWNQRCTTYCIPAADTNAYAIGDPVTLAGSADANGVPTIVLATAGTGNTILGATVSPGAPVYGTSPGIPPTDTLVIPATKTRAYYVMVCDHYDVLYEIQEDGVGGVIAVTSVGLNCNLVAGTNNGAVSGWMLDSSTVAAGATLQVKLRQLVQRADNALGTNAKWLVQINNTPLGPNAAGL